MTMGSRSDPVLLVGPVGIKEMIDTVFRLSDAHVLTYELNIIELTGDEPVPLGSRLGLDVMAVPLTHRVPAFGYIFTEPPRAGTLDAKKAISLGALKSQLGLLKSGEDVTLDNGTVILSASVVSASVPGKKIGVLQVF
jgi:ribonuclease Z